MLDCRASIWILVSSSSDIPFRLSSDFPVSSRSRALFRAWSWLRRMSVKWDALVSIKLVTPLLRNFHVVTSPRLHLTCWNPRHATIPVASLYDSHHIARSAAGDVAFDDKYRCQRRTLRWVLRRHRRSIPSSDIMRRIFSWLGVFVTMVFTMFAQDRSSSPRPADFDVI